MHQPPRPRFATLVVGLIVAVFLALHLITLAVTEFGIQRDEFLYFSMGGHLRLWRMDFPPLIAMVANLSRAVFDHTLAAVRVFPAIEGSVVVLLAALIARELGGGRFAQALAALCVTASVLFQRSSTLFQPVVLDQLWWTLALYYLTRLSREDRGPDWIGFGVAMGLGLLTKFSILFFGFGALIGIIIAPTRRWLATPWPWLAAAVAFAIGSPSIVGQAVLHYPVVGQMRDLQGQQLEHVSWSSFLVAQPFMVGPVPFLIAVAGGAALVASRQWRQFAVVGWTCLAAFALLFLLHGKPYYIGPIYPALFAAGSVVLESSRARMAMPLRRAAVVGTVVIGALVIPIGMPLLRREATAAYAGRVGASQSLRTNRGRMDRLPQDFADMIGWEEQSAALGRAVATLTPAERKEVVIFASNYGEAGAAEFYGARHGLPPIVSAAGSFWFFGPGTRPGNVIVTIGEDSAGVAKAYEDVRVAETIRSPWSVDEEREVLIIIGRKPKQSLQSLWPSLTGRQ